MKHAELRCLIVIVVLFGSGTTASATVLSDAANALSPGQFAMVSGMTNLNLTADPGFDALAGAPGPGYDGSQPGWSTSAKKLFIQATEHGRGTPGGGPDGCPGQFPNYPNVCWKNIWIYDDTTNTWSVDGDYPKYSGGGPVQ